MKADRNRVICRDRESRKALIIACAGDLLTSNALLAEKAFPHHGTVMILFIHPAVAIRTQRIPDFALHIISGGLLIVIIIDTVTTVGGVRHFNRLLLEAAKSFGNESWFVHRLGAQQKRMLKSFPALVSTRYSQALDRIRQAYFRLRGKGDTS